ncbi:hypothetical protein SLEP1_g25108 [Rubroshorea leprosula]|uniref:Uncharacterized protein n=1 Tax=Rubroshorea leprosula TaxID=152421 RepID=A0AAV5JS32_9ROSI|nr:hypothetical protein SLEP1_g25108 [Rubroshorea leprosula]
MVCLIYSPAGSFGSSLCFESRSSASWQFGFQFNLRRKFRPSFGVLCKFLGFQFHLWRKFRPSFCALFNFVSPSLFGKHSQLSFLQKN